MGLTNCGSQYIYVPCGCLYFDGTSDYITISETDRLSPTGDISLSAWINAPIDGSAGKIICKESCWYIGIEEQNLENKARLIFYVDAEDELSVEGSDGSFTPDTWQHIVGTYNSTTKTASLYKNAILIATEVDTGDGIIDDTANDIYIGSIDGTNDDYIGYIHDVRIYSGTCLTANQVKQIYNGINLSTGLVGYWKLNDRTGTTANDSTSYEHNGIISDAVWANRDIRCWNTRWDEQNYDVIIETFIDACDRNYLMDNIIPGAVKEVYNILGTPKFIDMTYKSGNTLIYEPIHEYGLSSLRQRRVIGIKNISDTFINNEIFGIKIEGKRLDVE